MPSCCFRVLFSVQSIIPCETDSSFFLLLTDDSFINKSAHQILGFFIMRLVAKPLGFMANDTSAAIWAKQSWHTHVILLWVLSEYVLLYHCGISSEVVVSFDETGIKKKKNGKSDHIHVCNTVCNIERKENTALQTLLQKHVLLDTCLWDSQKYSHSPVPSCFVVKLT